MLFLELSQYRGAPLGFKKGGDCNLIWVFGKHCLHENNFGGKIMAMGRPLMHKTLTLLHDGVLFHTFWCPWIFIFVPSVKILHESCHRSNTDVWLQ